MSSAVTYDQSVAAVRFLRSLYQRGNALVPQRTFARHIAEVRMHENPVGNAAANVQARVAVQNLNFWGIYHIIRKSDKLVKQQAVAIEAPKVEVKTEPVAEPVYRSRGC